MTSSAVSKFWGPPDDPVSLSTNVHVTVESGAFIERILFSITTDKSCTRHGRNKKNAREREKMDDRGKKMHKWTKGSREIRLSGKRGMCPIRCSIDELTLRVEHLGYS